MIEQAASDSGSFASWFSLIFMALGCFFAGWMSRERAGWSELEKHMKQVEDMRKYYDSKIKEIEK